MTTREATPQAPASSGFTRTLARGFAVLEALSMGDADDGTRLSDLAAVVGFDKATTTRLVRTLCDIGYAYQDEATKRYKLTGRILALASRFEESLNLPKRAEPFLAALRDAVDETVHLGIRQGDRVVHIAKLETSQQVKISSGVGLSNPLHSTALGKAIMSAMSEVDRNGLIDDLDLTSSTRNTITDRAALRSEVMRTEERGYSIDDRENEETISCVGAPVVNSAGQVVAAISISGPAFRIEPRVEELAGQCHGTAVELGATL